MCVHVRTQEAAPLRSVYATLELEMFDEVEEWRLIQAHYCIAWGVNQLDGGTEMLDAIKLTV